LGAGGVGGTVLICLRFRDIFLDLGGGGVNFNSLKLTKKSRNISR
jgi:hypothetical protein